MDKIKSFGEFINEGKQYFEEEINNVHNLFETSLIEQDFIKNICDGEPEYELDDEDGGDDGRGGDSWEVWIQLTNVKKEAIDDTENINKAFEKWLVDNDMHYHTTILTGEDGHSMTLNVTL